MIYFYSSSNKRDKLIHPITISSNTERKAYTLCVLNFKKNHFVGTPKRINI